MDWMAVEVKNVNHPLKMNYLMMKHPVGHRPPPPQLSAVHVLSLAAGFCDLVLAVRQTMQRGPQLSWVVARVVLVVHRLVVVDHRSSSYKSHNPRPMLPLRLLVQPPIPLVGPLNYLVCALRLLAARFLVAQFFAVRLLVVRLVLVALDKQAAPLVSYVPADRP